MSSLAQAMHAFQSGGLSHRDFLAQVDKALASDHANVERLSEILGEDHTRIGLPPEVYSELKRRVTHVTRSMQPAGDEETRVRTNPADRPAATVPASQDMSDIGLRDIAGAERIKGIGDTLNGRFVLEECIGFGGMGTVYKALDLRKLEASDRMPYIAIKVLNVQFRSHPKSLIALQREARKAQALAHPNIVQVYDFDRDGAMIYLTMEYLSGKPLSRLLRTPGFTGLPCAEAMRIIGGVSRALAYAHERGFVHCDLKPANVFLTDRGDVKVIDFGIARVFQKPEEDAEATVFDAGSLGGMTPAYASPEVIEHREPDPRDDIYALGCIAYELLAGRHPFDRLSSIQARGAGMKPQRPSKLGYREWRALKGALAFDRAARTPTVARFMQQMSPGRPVAAYAGWAVAALVAVGLGTAGLRYFHEVPGTSSGDSGSAATEGRATESPPAENAAPPAAPAMPALTMTSIAPVLARVPCSALLPSIQDHALQVQGYVPKSYGVERLRSMLSAAPGVASVSLNVREVGEHECGVIGVLGSYWKSSRQAVVASGSAASTSAVSTAAATVATIRTRAPNGELTEGDPLIVDITTPGYDSHVYVDYYVLDGNVAHLLPNPRARDNQAPPHYTATIGSLGNWVISKPFGNELIALVATPVPLFDGVRPEAERAGDYLKLVGKRLDDIAAKYGADRIAVDFVQIATRERRQ